MNMNENFQKEFSDIIEIILDSKNLEEKFLKIHGLDFFQNIEERIQSKSFYN